MSELHYLLGHYELTTAEIIYHLPDHPKLLQTFIWQDYDKLPDFPKLLRFLEFWSKSLDGKLHSVCVASAGHLIIPRVRIADFYGALH